ncbi:hypothetical protein QN219_31975 [Sinorhizobium sp. 7-81]|uniref:hypothetical protein n=1 Tax=unclassified Sinorhizobium TaxID=2613772 RepID=UPI0024C2B50E|nr:MULTISPECIES: hypothetical protein [unclassified Sinorhizobium]MDK1389938.1 hypothetical protein [Sinorhizobium sp. 7-81]MDK1494542.1 hypothetical protein [Sinorhizobium sp. 8-89]
MTNPQPFGRIDILPADERSHLLEELNRTAAPYPSDRCIHELFEAQVRHAPDAAAVVHEDERLSYDNSMRRPTEHRSRL